MDAMEAIFSRRSVRDFSDRDIESGKIDLILRAAMQAPSAVNKQPWHFVVIDEMSIFKMIMDFHPHAKMLELAKVAILVCGDELLHHGPGYWQVDCAAATQNILLAAHAQGLGAVWLGLHPKEDRKEAMSELMHLPHHVKPFSLVAMGYPKVQPERRDRYNEDKIHYNKW